MNPSLENPFRPADKRAKKRLFGDANEFARKEVKVTKEQIEKKVSERKVKYGKHQILFSQVQYLKEIEKLIPQEVLDLEHKSAQEIIQWTMKTVDEQGKIQMLFLVGLKLPYLPDLPDSLMYLNCAENHLTYLPELPKSLTKLDCTKNKLTSLPELPEKLLELYCSWNSLTSLPDLPLSLKTIKCDHNVIKQLPKLNNLKLIECQNNRLKDLPELPLTLLQFDCSNNQLTEAAKNDIRSLNNNRRVANGYFKA